MSAIIDIPIGDDGTNSSHTHNLGKSQSYRGLIFLQSDIKSMNTCSIIIDLKKCVLMISVCHMLVNE